jgi:7-cyano-7-deazaguanine tRNA-ribosyltransferase
MSFEVKEKDLLGRIGKLKTKTATVETPLLFPVINPSIQPIPPRRLKQEFGFEAIITNAYILKKRYDIKPIQQGLHGFLDFDGAIMTDSGAYQILIYGNVDVTQAEIVAYQESIGSDIATILDIPTGWKITKDEATETVKETLKRAKAFFAIKKRDDILWVGPVQGGRHLDLVAKSAVAMSKLPFQIHALGSPTEIMESYRYDVLVDMIMTAKKNLPPERPLHLFGAGHPAMFSLAVALGCDLFDSAAYALYARENRYMTENGTWRLNELDYFPCQCPRCRSKKPRDVQAMGARDRELFLAEHNLQVCHAELNRIKQAIREGRLWEHMEMRAHTHPSLMTALKRIKAYDDFIEKFSPVVKRSGLFFFGAQDLARPEIVHHRNMLRQNYSPPPAATTLLFVPQTRCKPFHKTREFEKVRRAIKRLTPEHARKVHVCFYAAPFGVVPLELDEVYPLSQHETALPLDQETKDHVAAEAAEYIKNNKYAAVVLLHDPQNWGRSVRNAAAKACAAKKMPFRLVNLEGKRQKTILTRLETILKKKPSD